MKHNYKTRKRQKMDSNASEARGWRAFCLLWWHRICVEKIEIQYFLGHLQNSLLRVHPCQRGKKDLPIMN